MSNSLTIYRTGTANLYDQTRLNLTQRQNTLTQLQESLTSGKRVNRPSDDPVAAAQAERAITRLSRVATDQRALEPFTGPLLNNPDYLFAGLPGQAASSGATIPTTVDGHAALMFDPVRDGVYTATVTRGAGSSLVTSAITTSNREALDGAQYALAVNTVTVDPVAGTTVVDYTLTKTAKDGTVTTSNVTTAPVKTGQPIPITINEGPDTVMSFSLTGTPAAGDSVALQPSSSLMGTIDSAIRGITDATDSVAASQAVGQALANIDAGMERLHNMRGYAGELLNRADRITGDQDKRSIQLEADRSRAEDLDMVQGISDSQNASVGYEAALKSYAQVQRLSLFNFIS
ncbi:MAG: flagellar hook-associated protein 3 [Acidovorax sp.]|nr:flagellar hook-associated protein 3 [Acidovorax sp.]